MALIRFSALVHRQPSDKASIECRWSEDIPDNTTPSHSRYTYVNTVPSATTVQGTMRWEIYFVHPQCGCMPGYGGGTAGHPPTASLQRRCNGKNVWTNGIFSKLRFFGVSNRSAGMISSRFPGNMFTKIQQNLRFYLHLPGRVTNPWDHTDPVYPSNSSAKGHLRGLIAPISINSGLLQDVFTGIL